MLPIHIIHQIAQALAEKYPESATDYFRMSEAISLITAGADIIAAREEVPSDVAYKDAFDDWHDAVRYDETVWYEPIVQKQKMHSLFGQPHLKTLFGKRLLNTRYGATAQDTYPTITDQPSAYQGETETTPVYQDTDTTYTG